MAITLRPIQVQDRDFLIQVYSSSRADEMALVPWTEEQKEAFLSMQFAAQDAYYRESFSAANFDVIEVDEQPVGRLYVLRDDTHIRILDIAVLPERRRAGVAGFLINDLLTEAKNNSKKIEIYVESFNPSLGFFEAKGFKKRAEEGINFRLEWDGEP